MRPQAEGNAVSRVIDELDYPAETDEQIFRECASRLKIAMEAESENRIRAIDALKFRWGDQWDADIRNSRKIEGRPALTINRTTVVRDRQVNKLRQQRPRIKCHPVGDGANVDSAETINGLIRHIEYRSNAGVAYDTGVGSAVDIGWGYWRIVSEYIDGKSFDQELVIKPITNTFTVYMDPSAKMPDGRDAKWVIISETMKREEYKRLFPNAKNADYSYASAPGDMSADWESKEEIRLAEYYRLYEANDWLIRYSDGSTRLKSELTPEAVAAIEALGLREVARRKTTRTEVQWFRINGCEVIEKRWKETAEPGEHIPVIRCEGNRLEVNGQVMRKGMIEDLKDPAQMYNYWRSQQTERYALQPKAPWIVAEGQTDDHPEWESANQRPYSKLVYKPVTGPDGVTLLPPPQRVDPPAIEAGFTEAASGAEHDFLAVAGMEGEDPEISRRVISGDKYLQRRQGMQDLTHYQYYENQALAIAWTGQLLLERIPYYYDTTRTQRILGEDGVPKVVELNKRVEEGGAFKVLNDVTHGRYAVVLDTGPGYATKREENAENMIRLVDSKLGDVVVQTGADVVLRNMDFPGADQLADRVAVTIPGALDGILEGLPKQAQTVIGALQAQIQQKDELLQQQALEIKYHGTLKAQEIAGRDRNNERDNLTKLQIAVGKAATDVQVQTQKDTTARDVAEIGAAAQLLNAHVESREEEAAADKLIEKGLQDSGR
jgi:hypothetical protein